MFKKLTVGELTEEFTPRKSKIKDLANKLALDPFYISILSNYKGLEITPDIIVFGYEEALKENRHLSNNFSELSERVWMIGRTGQGDEWFIDTASNNILFYDHNLGDYTGYDKFLNFEISFAEFLQMAFLYQSLEDLLDEKEVLDEAEENKFITMIDSIKPNLYERYRFKYW